MAKPTTNNARALDMNWPQKLPPPLDESLSIPSTHRPALDQQVLTLILGLWGWKSSALTFFAAKAGESQSSKGRSTEKWTPSLPILGCKEAFPRARHLAGLEHQPQGGSVVCSGALNLCATYIRQRPGAAGNKKLPGIATEDADHVKAIARIAEHFLGKVMTFFLKSFDGLARWLPSEISRNTRAQGHANGLDVAGTLELRIVRQRSADSPSFVQHCHLHVVAPGPGHPRHPYRRGHGMFDDIAHQLAKGVSQGLYELF